MRKIFTQLNEANQKFLSGNGMHLACLAAWLCYILSNIVRIDKPFEIKRPLSHDSLPEDDEVDVGSCRHESSSSTEY